MSTDPSLSISNKGYEPKTQTKFPTFDGTGNYLDWKKSVRLWSRICGVGKEDQATVLVLSLTGRPKEIALTIDEEDICNISGTDKMIKALDRVYEQCAVDKAYGSYKEFISFKRASEMSIADYLAEFERKSRICRDNRC